MLFQDSKGAKMLNISYIKAKLPYFIGIIACSLGFNYINGADILNDWMLAISFSIAAIILPSACLQITGKYNPLKTALFVLPLIFTYGFMWYTGDMTASCSIKMFTLCFLLIFLVHKAAYAKETK